MRHAILFDESSKSQYSVAFLIPPGSIGVISAYGLKKVGKPSRSQSKHTLQQAVVQKLAFSGGGICSCECHCDDDDPLDFSPDFLYAEDVTQCGVWHLDACQNTGVLVLPGTYRLFLDDETAVGNCFIHIVRYSQLETGYVPRNLIFGE